MKLTAGTTVAPATSNIACVVHFSRPQLIGHHVRPTVTTQAPRASSRLFYQGTSTEVRLGDRVWMKRFLRRRLAGVVCYIPGLSKRHEELEDAGVRQWAIRAENGCVYPILYDPINFQPPRRIEFVERGDDGLLAPDEHLE